MGKIKIVTKKEEEVEPPDVKTVLKDKKYNKITFIKKRKKKKKGKKVKKMLKIQLCNPGYFGTKIDNINLSKINLIIINIYYEY